MKTIRNRRYSVPERSAVPSAPPPSLGALQSLMWDKVGMVRNGGELEEAVGILASWQLVAPRTTDRPSYELSNLLTTGRLMAEAALLREESRGAHYRQDFPDPSPKWEHHITFRKG